MNKKIIVLNGAARKNGNTARLVEAFADGAKSAAKRMIWSKSTLNLKMPM